MTTVTTTTSARAEELVRARVPFVRATVVRAQEPTSAHPGDEAIVLADGTFEGFVGGHCAEGSVRTAALGALTSGQSVLLRVLPDGHDVFPESPGASIVVNPCLSGGAVEVYLHPLLPPPVLHLVGTSPAAEAIAALAPSLGFALDRGAPDDVPRDATVVVISTHGDEAGPVRAALAAGVGFVGVVCSRTRGVALLAELALGPQDRARVHPHVGVEIGARTAAELALSVLAAVVGAVRLDGLTAPVGTGPAAAPAPRTARDPACGMTVTVGPDTPTAVVDGVEEAFCGAGCRDGYLARHP